MSTRCQVTAPSNWKKHKFSYDMLILQYKFIRQISGFFTGMPKNLGKYINYVVAIL